MNLTFSKTALALSAAALLLACDEKKKGAASTTSTTSAATSSSGEDNKKSAGQEPARRSLAEALEPFKGALDVSDAKEVDPPEKPLAWNIPEQCKLGYQVDATFSIGPPSGLDDEKKIDPDRVVMRTRGLNVEADFELERGGPADWQLSHGDIVIAHTSQDVRRAPSVQPAGSTAKVWLEHEDGFIEEVQGPTATWSAFGTYPGPVVFFPLIPKSVGEELDWKVKFHARGSGLKVEIERGSTTLPENTAAPEPREQIFPARVAIDRWITLGGERVAILYARFTIGEGLSRDKSGDTKEDEEVKAGSGPKQRVDGELRGDYLITEDGQLLAARFTSTQSSTLSMGGGHALEQLIEGDYAARMVRGCDKNALTAAPFDRTRSPEELALTVWTKVRNSIVSDKIDEPLEPLFAPEVWAAHGDKIEKSLDAMVSRFGVYALGSPELAYEIDADEGTVRAVMTGNAQYYKSLTDQSRMTLHVVVNFRVEDGTPRITQVGIDTLKKERDWELFEISKDRLHMDER